MRMAQLLDGVVVNIIEAPEGFVLAGYTFRDATDADTVPVPVPSQVTARQLELALSAAGLLTAVQAAVAAADATTQITWNRMTVALRNDPILTGMATALGLSDAQVDAMFVSAAGL